MSLACFFIPIWRSTFADFCELGTPEAKNRGIWRKLRLVVVHSTKLYIPLSVNKSPFNVGLRPFKSDQVQDWAKRRQDWSGEDAQQLTGFVNRNTYLVRVALYHIGRGDVTLESKCCKTLPSGPEFMAIAYNDNCGT
ncbi:MAG: AAA-like domain-containing protein [Microcoleus sp. C1-bin4]|nr:AAA-like domain-containing protein [Microcoleus sp. C1-bin4]